MCQTGSHERVEILSRAKVFDRGSALAAKAAAVVNVSARSPEKKTSADLDCSDGNYSPGQEG